MIRNLINPYKFQQPISIKETSSHQLKKFLELMYILRKTEQKLAFEREKGFIGGPVHLSVGQEAISVGISKNLKKTDRVFGNHRSHSHLLSLNPNFYKLFAEILGKKTGFSKGMGGSMHLYDKTHGFYGSTPIVAGTVALAVGAAIAAKKSNLKDISVSYLGDGAIEEGVVHESFNLAKMLKLPILFVIENNLFASHMHISSRQPNEFSSRFADANRLPFKLLDGNNVVSVYENSKKIINKIRNGSGPAILELITFRWYGHVDWREDIDVGIKRSKNDIQHWKKRDPIKRLSQSMINSKLWSLKKEKDLNDKIDLEIKIAWDKARKDPFPSINSINKHVYSKD
ncbi:thiamine pyrophosphate-dependent dehydrogenase E1 component subunit alpha [Candidatus Pelagibacter sp. HIMB1623]|uniref:thiamine pyrophosphate-dependent dehydrogenase E1 component subunit alpha n=1 Tax=Candidatus Pelagibacter sp. HIMB1623 TaxID=3413358 RepID=UPI003F87AEB7